MFRKILVWLDRDIDRVVTPEFRWSDVVDHRVYHFRWRGNDRGHLYTSLEQAEVAHEWLTLQGKEPTAIRRSAAFQFRRRQ
jgi:hypothetical protein